MDAYVYAATGAFPSPFRERPMKLRNLRLIGITLAVLACWWFATSKSPLPSPVSANAEPPEQATAVSAETTQACQSVVYQIVAIQQFVMDEKLSSPFAAMDELVAQEHRIDASKCPTDFRQAMARLVSTETTARTHASMDQTGNADEALLARMEMFATQGPSTRGSVPALNDNDETFSEAQRQDLAGIRSALLNLAQMARKYGVK